MTDPIETRPFVPQRRSRGLPILLVALTAIGAAKAGAWFYFRNRQPVTDELTRERLQPRRGA